MNKDDLYNENQDPTDVLSQIRIPLSDITGISKLLRYNLKNTDNFSAAQINSMLDLLNALDENTSHILSLLNETMERDLEDTADNIQENQEGYSNQNNEFQNLDGKKVLVVDDIELNRVLINLMLKNVNMQVVEATNGQEAIEVLEKSEPNEFSVILMDIMMPIMDGYTATAKIRKNKREDIASIPVLAVTANAFEYYKKQAEDYGMNGYVTKPLIKEKLYEEISRVTTRQY